MRFGPPLALVLAGLAAACAPGASNDMAGNGAEAAAVPVVSAALGRDGVCAFRWDGEAASAQAIMDRGVVAMHHAIDAAGGLERIGEEDLPSVRIEAPADTPYSCFGQALTALQGAGYAYADLPPRTGVGGRGRPARLALFGLITPTVTGAPGHVTVTLANDERFGWDDESVDLAGLRARARSIGTGASLEEPAPPPPGAADAVPPRVELGPPPGQLVIAPAPDLTFANFADAVQVMFEGGVEPLLPPPSANGEGGQ